MELRSYNHLAQHTKCRIFFFQNHSTLVCVLCTVCSTDQSTQKSYFCLRAPLLKTLAIQNILDQSWWNFQAFFQRHTCVICKRECEAGASGRDAMHTFPSLNFEAGYCKFKLCGNFQNLLIYVLSDPQRNAGTQPKKFKKF